MTSLLLRFPVLACIAVAMASGANAATASSAAVVGRFDFAYSISGDPQLRPVQVFDDGVGKTYFQFRPGNALPAVFAAAGKEILLLSPEGPYQVVSSRARDFVLAMGLARGRVVHSDVLSGAQPVAGPVPEAHLSPSPGGPLATSASAFEPARHDVANPTLSSYATPLRGDVIQWVDPGPQEQQAIFFAPRSAVLDPPTNRLLARLAERIGPRSRVQVMVRGEADPTQELRDIRAQALRASLIENGVPAAHITVQPVHDIGGIPALEHKVLSKRKPARLPSYVRWSSMASADSSPPQVPATAAAYMPAEQASPGHYVMYRSDATVETALRRWGRAAGYEVLWDAPMTPVSADTRFHASSFLDALDQLLRTLRSVGHPLHRVMKADRVVRIAQAH